MINLNRLYKPFAGIMLTAGFLFAGCSNDDINVTPVKDGDYAVSAIPVALTVNADNKANNDFVEFREQEQVDLFLTTTKAVEVEANAQFFYNKALLERYNFVNGTTYAAYPEELVQLNSDGVVTFAADSKKSSALALTINSAEENDTDVTYVIPVSAKAIDEGTNEVLKLDKGTNYFIFVRDLTKLPDATKPPYVDGEGNETPAVKVISCMEVNDTNPLNNLCFTLKNSGKPLVDIVILFSGNINYNPETGRVFNHNNPNVQHLLDNKDKYLKPLQDRGIKVVLGILGNHDIAGVNNLAPETAKAFAQELKAVCDAYSLDGIFWDDEYSKWPDGTPGFESGGASRLIYETKQAMPDKLNCVYAYSTTGHLSEVDGVQPGQYIDWAIDDYRNYQSGSYAGITNAQWSVASQEFNRGYWVGKSTLERLRNDGCGGHMIFAMDPLRGNSYRQISAMRDIADALYDDELVVADEFFEKDW